MPMNKIFSFLKSKLMHNCNTEIIDCENSIKADVTSTGIKVDIESMLGNKKIAEQAKAALDIQNKFR
jgi:hypothetical protein